jgi:alpha-1,2-mannosyltransferase
MPLLTFALGVATVTGLAIGLNRVRGRFIYGVDYDVYRTAGLAVLHRESLFGPWMGSHLSEPLPFTYPPVAAVLSVPFALIRDVPGYVIWNLISLVVLVFVVRECTRPLRRRVGRPVLVIAAGFVLALALSPVQDEIGFGQVGIVLMAMCLFDCNRETTPWPRGSLVGAATAIKLVPGIFIPYLWLSGRRRAATVAVMTFTILAAIVAVVAPRDSWTFWTSRWFNDSRVGDNKYFSNQSLNGMLQRALGSGPEVRVLWVLASCAVLVYGLRHAAAASRRGDELLGIALIATAGVLVSPVSWIHHLVWLVPVLAVLLGDATDGRRAAIVVGAAGLLALRLPYVGATFPTDLHLPWLAALLRDSYGVLSLVLLIALGRMASRAGPHDSESAPSCPTVPALGSRSTNGLPRRLPRSTARTRRPRPD